MSLEFLIVALAGGVCGVMLREGLRAVSHSLAWLQEEADRRA